MPQNYCYFQRFHVLLQASIINAMEAKHNSDNFEAYWAEHKSELIARAPQHLRQEREDALKMNTAGDWLLAIVPIIVMVAFRVTGYFLWVEVALSQYSEYSEHEEGNIIDASQVCPKDFNL